VRWGIDFLGDPTPDPRFLASLGALSLVELDYCSLVDLLTGWTCPASRSSLDLLTGRSDLDVQPRQ
jgi:hypothetical protein